MAEEPTSKQSSLENKRNKNVQADELQALLKACIDVGIEKVRREGGRTDYLFYDVQQRMMQYGDFPERKLYMLQHNYLRIRRNFLSCKLDPYPPEARLLWGTAQHKANASDNDDRWSTLLHRTLQRQESYSYVLKVESWEIIRQALQRNLENLSTNQQDNAFEQILLGLREKKLFLNRDVMLLKQTYFRMRKQFLSGKTTHFPPEASQLWRSDETETVHLEPPVRITRKRRLKKQQLVEETTAADTSERLCRICQAQLLKECKDLLQDTYCSQTYEEIIQETVQVMILCDEQTSSKICLLCSKFVENLLLFVQQCRQACSIPAAPKIDEKYFFEEDSFLDTDRTDAVAEYLNEAIEERLDEDVLELRSPTLEVEFLKPKLYQNNTPEKTITDEQKYREFVKSRPTRNKRKQCHLCGKSVIDLVSHLTSHSGVEFQCQFCPRKCPNERQLTAHMNVHTKKNKYPCRICDRVFYVWTSRKNHEFTHNVKFSCDKCDAVYAYAAQLQVHIKQKHLGIRHLACSQCPFRTSNRARLRNHVRSIHTSERPYRCTFCESTSNCSTGYYIHFQRHKKSGEATEYSILCAYCGLQFNKDVALERHICDEHPEVAVVV
ncbi:zinc finger protein 699-like [Wyeomyia smithii]|uniref:zinc finger protein 699-like n=1 Tax=Wyeomyia smithii TaxID=174621 RepID=UPI002467DF1E|nr:zinc finger protein 699-like [Wyeomyia smithii]